MKKPLKWWRAVRRAIRPKTFYRAFDAGYDSGFAHGNDKYSFELRRLQDELQHMKDWRNEAIRLSREGQTLKIDPAQAPLSISKRVH